MRILAQHRPFQISIHCIKNVSHTANFRIFNIYILNILNHFWSKYFWMFFYCQKSIFSFKIAFWITLVTLLSLVVQKNILSSHALFNLGIAFYQSTEANKLFQSNLGTSPNIGAQFNNLGNMDGTALLNQPREMNAHHTSTYLTDLNICPEFTKSSNVGIANHQEMWRAGIILNQYFLRY